jgi:hypothetical protein
LFWPETKDGIQLKTRNRNYYCKQITKAVNLANQGKKIYGNELFFEDTLDWEAVSDRGIWTDVHFLVGKDSVFAFTATATLGDPYILRGSSPEAIRDIETGLWDLYLPKEYLTQDDVGELCKKWLALQAPIDSICLGCNVYFNKKRLGHQGVYEQYPGRRLIMSECPISQPVNIKE